jgi:hypothetical protein
MGPFASMIAHPKIRNRDFRRQRRTGKNCARTDPKRRGDASQGNYRIDGSEVSGARASEPPVDLVWQVMAFAKMSGGV